MIKAGVTPERIRPGKPQENGRHERMHLTLLQDTADPPAATLRAQQKRFAGVPGRLQRGAAARRPRRRDARGRATPPRRGAGTGCCARPRPIADETRAVKSNGLINWHGRLVYVSEALGGEPVGLAETDGGLWTVRYGPILLGFIEHRGDELKRPKKGADGLVDNAARCPQGPQPQQQQPPRT